jgi:hypothetical protein
MKQSENSQGLKRAIPEQVTREVRRRCNFGCIYCGEFLVEYHHFDPEFANAKNHVSAGITLLCPSCHQKVHNALITPDEIREIEASPKPQTRTTLLNRNVRTMAIGCWDQPIGPMIMERLTVDGQLNLLFGLTGVRLTDESIFTSHGK